MYINYSNYKLFQQEMLKKRKLILSLPRMFVGIPKLNYFSIIFVGSDCKKKECQIKLLAERGFDPRTSGLWAQHASMHHSAADG